MPVNCDLDNTEQTDTVYIWHKAGILVEMIIYYYIFYSTCWTYTSADNILKLFFQKTDIDSSHKTPSPVFCKKQEKKYHLFVRLFYPESTES